MTSKGVTTTTLTKSTKTRIASRFLRSLLKMKKTNRIGPTTSSEEISRRSYRIKIAAYTSMARSVGLRRAWSRALLFKLRNRASSQQQGVFRKRCLVSKKKKRVLIKNKVSAEPSRADSLRKLVPGGDFMDICTLLEETAHYVKCLATQVKVMQRIADHYPNENGN